MDILELAKAQDLEVIDSSGNLVTDTFIERMEEYQQRDTASNRGIVWCWLVSHWGRSYILHWMVKGAAL